MANRKIEECIYEYIKELEREFMEIINNPKMDKKAKNLATKPLASKKKILLNTIDALNLVDKESQKG
ncbi:hypothetical protein [Nitrosophilus alvini]|uniref:hypothetical protein n=1 Tax=Nitrosophilus alvini TaxID=2714855 RepID=UPI001909404C|nr:hypothetical protein [Nitrosophilus alvini]